MSKLTLLGITFLLLGILSGIIQNTFYGYVDAEGVLRDSLFLPLSFLFIGLGLVLFLVKTVLFFLHRHK